MRPSLAVVAICKNEEKDLPAFLAHLGAWVDEIVIVDDSSTDASCELIREAGPRVKLVEQAMDPETGFSGLRNCGIEHAESDWLLHTDVDERVPAALAREISFAISNDRYRAWRYRRLNFFLHRPMRGGGFQDWNKPQLARRGFHHFENVVHEQCVIDGGDEYIGQLDEMIWHLNDDSYKERMYKSNEYCQEQARRLANRGIRMRWWHLVALPMFEFGRKYFLKRGFIDGMPGLIFSLHAMTAMYRACALVWDEQNRIPRQEVEQQLNGRED